ncbi:MAG: GtrA family protein [Balneolaceae bacterium]
MRKVRIIEFIVPKLKYIIAILLATGLDYALFFLLVKADVHITISQVIAYIFGVLIKFILLKVFVFNLNRPLITSFQLVILFSAIGFCISTGLVHLLHQLEFFYKHLFLMKILVTGVTFIYNFYTKRYAFEGSKKQKLNREVIS